MWFKNLYLLKLKNDFELNYDELNEQLQTKLFQPCASDQRESIGWVSPFGRDSQELVLSANGEQFLLVTMAHQERLLPASVIKEILDEKVQAIQDQEDRKVSNKEKKELREQIEFELLPRAFTRTRRLDAWLDIKNGWVVLNSASAAQAERLTGLLRKTLGSFPTNPLDAGFKPAHLMTQWLKQGHAQAPFELGDMCELRATGDQAGVVVFKQHELNTDEVMLNLNAGKLVSKIMLTWADKLSFVLTEDLQIKRLKFLDIFDEKMSEQDPQSHAEQLDISFTLMTAEVAALLDDVSKFFLEEKAGKKEPEA